jgi:SAM-dependent methyltransferase
LKTGKVKDLWAAASEFRIEVIELIMPESGLILDIGSGGVDYNVKKCQRITMDITRGRPTVWGTAERLPFKSETFNLVISTEVIEHVRKPKRMLDEVHRVIKNDGKWLLSTPNIATLANRIALFFLGRFPPDRTLHDNHDVGHLHFWDRKFLLDILSKNGFRVEKSWHKFLQISPKIYISSSFMDKIFKNFLEQNLYLCNKV